MDNPWIRINPVVYRNWTINMDTYQYSDSLSYALWLTATLPERGFYLHLEEHISREVLAVQPGNPAIYLAIVMEQLQKKLMKMIDFYEDNEKVRVLTELGGMEAFNSLWKNLKHA